MRTNYDSEQIASGSAVTKGTDGPVPSGFDSANYFDRIDILTGSIEGNTRIKVRGAMAINITTSSVADLYLSAYYGGNYPPVFPEYIPVDINVYRSGSTTGKELLANGSAAVYRYNPSLANGSVAYNTSQFRIGNLSAIPDFNWKPTTTDGFPVTIGGGC